MGKESRRLRVPGAISLMPAPITTMNANPLVLHPAARAGAPDVTGYLFPIDPDVGESNLKKGN